MDRALNGVGSYSRISGVLYGAPETGIEIRIRFVLGGYRNGTEKFRKKGATFFIR